MVRIFSPSSISSVDDHIPSAWAVSTPGERAVHSSAWVAGSSAWVAGSSAWVAGNSAWVARSSVDSSVVNNSVRAESSSAAWAERSLVAASRIPNPVYRLHSRHKMGTRNFGDNRN